MVGSRIKSGRDFQTVGPATEKAQRPLSVEPVARYCKQLTVGGTQVLPSIDTGGWNAFCSPTGTAVRGRSDTEDEHTFCCWVILASCDCICDLYRVVNKYVFCC